MTLEELAKEAEQGDQNALEKLILEIQDRIYGLSLRMLWHPQDAEDATQEILIRIVTHLSTFRKESSFSTWVYRVACNYLLTTRKRRMERQEITFPEFARQLDEGLIGSETVAPEAQNKALVNEIKIGCTQAMLLCLDRNLRVAYILGDILELTSVEGAFVLDTTPATFRKRLSRARRIVTDFLNQNCGIVNPLNRCRCALRIPYAIRHGRLDSGNLLFSNHPVKTSRAFTEAQIQKLDMLRRAAALFRSNPDYASPDVFLRKLQELVGRQEDQGRGLNETGFPVSGSTSFTKVIKKRPGSSNMTK